MKKQIEGVTARAGVPVLESRDRPGLVFLVPGSTITPGLQWLDVPPDTYPGQGERRRVNVTGWMALGCRCGAPHEGALLDVTYNVDDLRLRLAVFECPRDRLFWFTGVPVEVADRALVKHEGAPEVVYFAAATGPCVYCGEPGLALRYSCNPDARPDACADCMGKALKGTPFIWQPWPRGTLEVEFTNTEGKP